MMPNNFTSEIRPNFLDWAKALGIFLVIFGHYAGVLLKEEFKKGVHGLIVPYFLISVSDNFLDALLLGMFNVEECNIRFIHAKRVPTY